MHERALYSFSLLRYLEQRRIPIDLAEQFCREVKCELNGKEYFAIGFKITRVVMNYVTLIISSAAPQKTLQRLTIKVKKQLFLKVFSTSFFSWQFKKNQEQIESNL